MLDFISDMEKLRLVKRTRDALKENVSSSNTFKLELTFDRSRI